MSETQEQYGNGAEKRPLTAVEWLEDVYNTQGRILPTQFEQAKEMEKEQICTAYLAGDCQNLSASEYYKQTFQREK